MTSAPHSAEVLRQIGEVADLVGLSLRTIRYYEEVDLVTPSGRSVGGFRLYTDADVARLRLVKVLKPLKFTLEEMRDLLELRDRLDRGAVFSVADAERLRAFADLASDRSERLRDQLQAAESLARCVGARREPGAGAPRRRVGIRERRGSGLRGGAAAHVRDHLAS